MNTTNQMYQAPSQALIEKAVTQLIDINRRRVFFDKLVNPYWLDALDAIGWFDQVEDLVPGEDGRWSVPQWPEGVYLERVAESNPSRVVDILLRAGDTDNFDVQDTVIRVSKKIPEREVARLVPLLVSYLAQQFRYRLDALSISEITCSLLTQGEYEQGVVLARALFPPRDQQRPDWTTMETYWYGEYMPPVARAISNGAELNGLKELCSWLTKGLESSTEYRQTEPSAWWRPSIPQHFQNNNLDEALNAIVDTIRDESEYLVKKVGPLPVANLLANYPQDIFIRLWLYFLAKFDSSDLQRARRDALMTPELALDIYRRHEYAILARSILGSLSSKQEKAWLQLVTKGTLDTDDEIKSWFTSTKTETPDIGLQRKRLARDILAAIGSDHLPEQARHLLTDLIRQSGPPREHVDFPIWHESGVHAGWESPLTNEEVREKSPSELVEFLLTWPNNYEIRSLETPHGLAQAIEVAVAETPDKYAEHSLLFSVLNPTYIRGILSGYEKALREERLFSWNQVLPLVKHVTNQLPKPSNETNLHFSSFDMDQTWRNAQNAAISLIETGIRSGQIPLTAASLVYECIHTLLENADPSPEYEQEYGGSNMDPLTLSLNTVRPKAIRGAILFIRWLSTNEVDESLAARILQDISHLLETSAQPNLATHAAIGEGLMTLYKFGKSWTDTHLDQLVGSTSASSWTPEQDVVWTTTFATHNPHHTILDLLGDRIEPRLNAIIRGYIPTPGWRKGGKSPWLDFAIHVLMTVAWNYRELNDSLVISMLNNLPDEDMGEIMSHLGWMIFRTEESVDTDVINRFQKIWENRANAVRNGTANAIQLEGFLWWARSNRFATNWWLLQMEHAAQLGVLDTRGGVGEVLAAVAADYPSQTLSTFNAILNMPSDEIAALRMYSLNRFAAEILVPALDSDDPSLQQRAKKVMDLVGAQGRLNLRDEIQAFRESGVTPDI